MLFVVQLLISRFWGAHTLGEYLLFVAAINITAVVLPLGFQFIGGYFAADYAARGQGALLRRFTALSYVHIVLVASLLVVAVLFVPFPAVAWVQLLVAGSPAVIVGGIALASTFVCGFVLVGLRRPLLSFTPDALVRPVGILLVVGAAILMFGPDEQPLWFLVGGLATVLAVNALGIGAATFTSLRQVPAGDGAATPSYRRWWRFALPWVLIALATDVLFDLDLLLLAGHLPSAELAVFGVSARFFVLAAFGVSAVYSVFMPDLFDAEARADQAALDRRIGQTNVLALAMAAASLAGAAIVGPLALSLFGDGFEAGYPVLLILFCGLVVRSFFGPGALVVSLRDRPYANLPVAAAGLVALVAGNMVLVAPFGLSGAALAALLAITVWSAGWWIVCRKITGVDVSVWRLLARRHDGAGRAEAQPAE